MFKKVLFSVIILILLVSSVATAQQIVIKKLETIKSSKDMDKISQFMYQGGKYGIYQINFKLDQQITKLTELVLNEFDKRYILKNHKIKLFDINSDRKIDYIITFPASIYIVDGQSRNLIFGNKNYPKNKKWRFENFTCKKNKIIITTYFQDQTGPNYIYIWNPQKRKFVKQ